MTQPLLAADVSLFDGSVTTTPVETIPLAAVLQRIQDGAYRASVAYLRQLLTQGNTARYRREKAKSLAFTPCCALHTRGKDIPWPQKLISTTGLVHFDLDHLDDPDAVKRQLAQDGHIAFAFVSPSARGLKIGVAASGITGPEDYKHAWAVVLDTLKRLYPAVHFNEDLQVKFLHALCYVSYDPALYVNGDAAPLISPPPAPTPPRQLHAPDDPSEYTRVARALACIANHDADYETWLMLGMALHSTQQAWARDLWDGWSRQSGKFDARKQAKSWESFRSDGHVTIASLFHLAKQHEYVPPRQAVFSAVVHNGHGMSASAEAQQHGSTSQGQGATPQAAPPALDPVEAARQAAEALLQTLSNLAEDAKEDAVLDALPGLAPLDTIHWMRLKRQIKIAVPGINLHDLERARHELRRTAAPQALPASGISQAQIAAALAKDYAGQFAYDLSRQGWMAYEHGLWKPLETERVTQRIMACMDAVLQGDYTWHACAGVEHLLRARLAQTVPLETPGWLPFQNGALCLATMTLHPHTPERPFTWQLPHAYDPQATCPQTQAWLHEAAGGAHDQVQVLRAYAKAVVTRRVDLQRYLETLGPGGTGKGTYTRLLMALVGIDNTCATELKHLEANRFELSQLRGKVLMVITDAERYSGPVNALKAITGQDFVRMEEKFKAQRTEVAPVMVVVAANEPVQSADYTSGLVRRRLSMAFRHRPTVPRDLLSWHAGAWHGALAPEIPGVLNWVLTLPDAQMEALLQQTTTLVPSLQATWASSLVDTNPLAEWANQALILDARTNAQGTYLAIVNVGRAHKMDQTNAYAHQDRWLYPHYRAWVDDTGGKPLSSRRFTGLLRDLFDNQLRLNGVVHTDDMYGSRFHGLRLRTANDAEAPFLITGSSPPMTALTPAMTANPHTHDGCDACDGFLQRLASPLPSPCPSDDPSQGGGGSLGEDAIHPSYLSYPSSAQRFDVMVQSYPSLAQPNGGAVPPGTVLPPPCAVCGGTERWDHAGVLRCVTCWPLGGRRTPAGADAATSAAGTTRGDPP